MTYLYIYLIVAFVVYWISRYKETKDYYDESTDFESYATSVLLAILWPMIPIICVLIVLDKYFEKIINGK